MNDKTSPKKKKGSRAKRGYWNMISTLDDAQKFIDDNNILNVKDCLNRFSGFYSRLEKLKLKTSVKWKDPGCRDQRFNELEKPWFGWTELEQFQNFIDENSIDSPKDCVSRFGSSFLDRAGSLGFRRLLNYPRTKTKSRVNWGWVKTPNDVQTFINENRIESYSEMNNKYPALVNIIQKNKWKDLLNFKRKFPKGHTNFIKTLEDAQNYVDKMGYSCSTELRNDSNNNGQAIYTRIKSLGLASKIKYPARRMNNWSNINTERILKSLF